MTKFNSLPAIEDLAANVYVDESSPSGIRWRVTRGSRAAAGAKAGSLNSLGYWEVGLLGRRFLVHRIVYALVHNVDPGELQIDHIDRNPSNNKAENLRAVDKGTNEHNTGARRNSKTGIKGVHWSKVAAKYQSSITVRNVKHHLGYFSTLTEAVAARQAAEVEYAVHVY